MKKGEAPQATRSCSRGTEKIAYFVTEGEAPEVLALVAGGRHPSGVGH